MTRTTTAALALLTLTAAARAADDAPTFERDVRPLVAKRCVVCHSAKTLDQPDVSGGLALDSYEATMAGVKGRPVVVAGKSGASELVRRLTDADEDRRMPLNDRELPESDRKRLARWVDAGAPRGEPVAGAAAVAESKPNPRRKTVRSLDVVLAVEAKVPSGVKALAPGGAVQVAVKVGPLPAVTSLAFRGDGRLLAVGTYGAVVVWDLVDARPACVLPDEPGPVHALAFSRDGRRLAVGSGLPARSGTVRVYDVPGGTRIQEFAGHSDVVFGLAFRPDGAQIASASFDQTVRLWNLALGRSDGVFRGHSDFVYDVAYDRDGKSVLSVSKDRSVKRFDAAKVKELRTYSDHNDDILAVAVAPRGGGQFVTAGHEPQLRWWAADGDKPSRRQGGHGGAVQQLAFSGDGSRLISCGGDGSVRLWDGKTGSSIRTLQNGGEWQYAAALSDDGSLAAAGGWDGVVRLWDASAGKLRATLIQCPSAESGRFDWLAVAPSGYLAASPALRPLVRWKVGGRELSGDAPRAVFDNPDALARALRGEAVPPAFK